MNTNQPIKLKVNKQNPKIVIKIYHHDLQRGK